MQYIILDLEWNAAYSRRRQGFINEIIEFGAVKVDGHLQVVDTFSALVRPQVGKKISGKVRSLTNITNEELVGGHAVHAGDEPVSPVGRAGRGAHLGHVRYPHPDRK